MLALIPLFPLLGFLLNGIWYVFGQAPRGKTVAKANVTGWIATACIFLSFLISIWIFWDLNELSPHHRVIEQMLAHWIAVGKFDLDFAFRVDPLSSLFTLVITGVGTLIHIYSIGYMSHDATPGKFFAYLNLFCFAMLILVLGASLPILFLGWEGVGLCSYLLIGYWYDDEAKAKAGKKAFIVNRVGDFGLLLGMFLIFSNFGTLDFDTLHSVITSSTTASAHALNADLITCICLLLFLGCTGKSAQIPLYIWLPDAMAGPTPVSALIHAATMVTSGIYLLARLNFLYELSPMALQVIAIVGGLTAFFAATIAWVQRDIKKVLAYSTVSQLGYMFLACGVGAYTAGIFHVLTHAFFKALLFLAAGSVIHGMHEEQDIVKMGGLRSRMPQTFFVFMVGWLSICGLPPFSGFFSKDEILWQVWSFTEHAPKLALVLGVLGLLTAVMTAFYMTRLFYLTFFGAPRFHEDAQHPVHESPQIMLVPLQILAVLSAVGGFLSIPHFSWLDHWLASVIPAHEVFETHFHMGEWLSMGASVFGALAGLGIAFRVYCDIASAEKMQRQFMWLHKLAFNRWYIDELYDFFWVRPIHAFSVFLWKIVDVVLLDGIVLGCGSVTFWLGSKLRKMQTGSIQVYAWLMVVGLALIVGYLFYV